MKTKHLLIILIPIAVFVLSFVCFFVYQVAKGTSASMAQFKRDSVAYSSVLPNEYSAIIKKKDKLLFSQTITSKTRSPFFQFRYTDSSLITIYSMGSISNAPFNQLITETNAQRHITYDTSYTTLFENKWYELQSKSGNAEKISHIYVNSYRSKPTLISRTDSLAYYRTNFTNLDIKRSLNGPQDLFCGVKNNYIGSIYGEIMFLKRNGKLYVIIACNDKNGDKKGNILESLIN